MFSEHGNSNLAGLKISLDNYENIENNFNLNTKIKTNYKFVQHILSKFNMENILISDLEGDISGYLNIDNKNKIDIYNYLFEANLENFKAIDFKKGCYVGQENTARMKLKNKITKRLLPISSKNELSISKEIFYNEKIVGNIFGLQKFANPQKFVSRNAPPNYGLRASSKP